jgi:Pyruvate/2-oxoacid:ferredoxin oxidoreductase delta subunit
MSQINRVQPSTRAFLREARQTHGYRLFDLLHGYFYARWPYLYIGVGTGEHRIAKIVRPILKFTGWLNQLTGKPAPSPSDNRTAYQHRPSPQFADEYHGKVMPLESVKLLVTVREPVRQPVPETVLPYARARDLILEHPDHIVALDCPCRVARENPCLPLDVCLIVGEPFASFVADHHPERTRWITSDEAVQILQAEDDRGHVHHAFFKEAMLGRFYAICNCCSCCCGAMQAHQNGTPMLAASGYLAQVDEAACIGCGTCNSYCQFEALSMDGHTLVDQSRCMGCGICVSKCPEEAISLVMGNSGAVPLELADLMAGALEPRQVN